MSRLTDKGGPWPFIRTFKHWDLVMRNPEKKALYLSDSFIPSIAKATTDGVIVLDREYRILWMNDAILKKKELPEKEILGRYCYQITHNAIGPCDSPDSPCPMKETLITKKSAHAIHEHIHHDRTSYCDVSTFPLFDAQGNVVQVLEVLRDITEELKDRMEKKELSIKKDLSRLVLEDKLISLGKMVASVAHEINNPIAAIINFNKLILKSLQEDTPDEKEIDNFKQYLNYAISEAQRCSQVVSNLLSFSRQKTIAVKSIDLVQMIDRIITLTRHTMELSNIEIIKTIENESINVECDESQVQQCITNFVFNAIESMPDGGQLHIGAGIDKGDQMAFFEVTDTGVGIPPENIDRIFEPFFTTKAAMNGVGMGLSIVYGIIKNHKGDISVNSELNKGTSFKITLPLKNDEV